MTCTLNFTVTGIAELIPFWPALPVFARYANQIWFTFKTTTSYTNFAGTIQGLLSIEINFIDVEFIFSSEGSLNWIFLLPLARVTL